MKKLPLIVIFVLLRSFSSLCQDTYFSYAKMINKAEMAIVHQNFKQAQTIYDSAFAIKSKKFSKDYYNALVCSIIIKNIAKSEEYISTLIDRGALLDNIKTDTVINKVMQMPFWANIITDYSARHKKAIKKFNYPLFKELEFLRARDQHMRGREGSYKVWGDTIKKLDVINYKRLDEIFETYGFPDEELIGNENPRYDDLPHYIILRHLQGDKEYDRSVVMKKAVIEGRFSAKYFAWVMDYENDERHNPEINFGVTLYYEIDNQLYLDKFSDKFKLKVNRNRESVGLENVDDYQQKILYERKDKRFNFGNHSGISTMSFTNEQDKKSFIEGFK